MLNGLLQKLQLAKFQDPLMSSDSNDSADLIKRGQEEYFVITLKMNSDLYSVYTAIL